MGVGKVEHLGFYFTWLSFIIWALLLPPFSPSNKLLGLGLNAFSPSDVRSHLEYLCLLMLWVNNILNILTLSSPHSQHKNFQNTRYMQSKV